jgi:hypothetical protein
MNEYINGQPSTDSMTKETTIIRNETEKTVSVVFFFSSSMRYITGIEIGLLIDRTSTIYM